MRYQDKLNEISKRTGINFTRYRNPALVEKLGNILTIQLYAAKAIFIPMMVLLLLFGGIAGYAIISAKVMAGVVIGVIGIFLSIALGTLIGMVLLMSTIKNDVQSILVLSLDTVSTILQDINAGIQKTATKATDLPSALPKPSDLLQGVTFGVILPSLQQIIVSKFKMLRTPLEYLFNTTILAVVNTSLTFIDEKVGDLLGKHTGKVAGALSEKVTGIVTETSDATNQRIASAVKRLEEVKQMIESKIDRVGSKIIAPVKFVMVLMSLGTVVLVTIYIKLFI